MAKRPRISWLKDAEEHDYPAARSFLQLLHPRAVAEAAVRKLMRADVVEFAAKDIFRAPRLPLLGAGNSHAEADLKMMQRGHALSPLLLVRDEPDGKVVIADGYHRLCAVYTLNEDARIPCKIV